MLPIMLPLLVAPDSTFLRIELAVVIGVDLIEPLAVELVTFPGRHRRQLVVMDLAPLKARLVGCGKASGGQLPGEPPGAVADRAFESRGIGQR